jgi:predicted TIM-barrel fold metal-dependent hydrolase
MADYQKISADDHIDLGYLPPSLWTDRVPKALRDRAPHVEDRGEAGDFWICDGVTWGDYRSERWFAKPRRNPLALDRGGVAEAHRPVTTHKRLEDMDRDGVEASLLFPPIIPLAVPDRALRRAVVSAYNDWAIEFGQTAPDRLLPIAMLSPQDPLDARDELVRVAKTGKVREASFLVNDVTLEINLEAWDPFWDAAEETGMIVAYHAGGSARRGPGRAFDDPPTQEGRAPAFGMGLGSGGVSFFEPFVNLMTYGTIERRPGLRFILAESGTGWIPFVVQEMDHRFERLAETGDEHSLKERPSETFRRQVWATFQTDLVGMHLVEFFGEGHVMWASDYPHHDSTWPFSQQVVDREMAHLPPATKRQIVRGNAAALYGLPA